MCVKNIIFLGCLLILAMCCCAPEPESQVSAVPKPLADTDSVSIPSSQSTPSTPSVPSAPSAQKPPAANTPPINSSYTLPDLKEHVVPLSASHWHILQYSSIKANTVSFSSNEINIGVQNSSSPLIYSLTHNPLNVTGVVIKGQVNKLVTIYPLEKQGQPGWDDFSLRLGLVLSGNNQLSWYQKLFAPDWIKKMHSLAPPNQGIDYIYFLNAVLSPGLLNKHRTHPISEYIEEHYVWLMNQPGAFSFSHQLPAPKQVVGLWLSSDGDDTGSAFNVQIQHLSLAYRSIK